MKLSLREIAAVTASNQDWQTTEDMTVTSVEFDARKVSTGSLFVPLEGGTRDGHEFLSQARENGAVVAFWSDTTEVVKPTDFPVIEVEDTLVAMQKLAVYYLNKVGAKVIGITGSNGKTTTKDLVASVLSQAFATYKTQGNYNNQIGLPYTILAMPEMTEMLVLEMGMDRFDEIAFLSQLAKPDIAAITMIGESHLEHLGSRQGIAQAKMEIVTGLKSEGLLIVPSEEPLLTDLLADITQEIQYFGEGAKSQLRGKITQENQTSTEFVLLPEATTTFTLPLIGRYNVNNALIAIGIGRHFGMSESEIVNGLAHPNLTQSRTEWRQAANGGKILSDVYNANPTAMGLVLQTFSELTTTGKRIAVLGDMKELGPSSPELHESIAAYLNPATIQVVFLYGEEIKPLYEALRSRYAEDQLHYFTTEARQELYLGIKENFAPTDLIVLKGSNSMKLIEIVEKLIEN